jgi:hypothetical protein
MVETKGLQSMFIAGSIEKIKVGDQIASRIKEQRDIIFRFNDRLAGHRFYQDNPFLWGLYHRVPDRLTPIIIRD